MFFGPILVTFVTKIEINSKFCILLNERPIFQKKCFFQFEIKNAHSQRIIRNISTATPRLTIEDMQPSSDFIINVYSYLDGQKSKPYRLEGFTTRSGEKQLATKPELESRNPLKYGRGLKCQMSLNFYF